MFSSLREAELRNGGGLPVDDDGQKRQMTKEASGGKPLKPTAE